MRSHNLISYLDALGSSNQDMTLCLEAGTHLSRQHLGEDSSVGTTTRIYTPVLFHLSIRL